MLDEGGNGGCFSVLVAVVVAILFFYAVLVTSIVLLVVLVVVGVLCGIAALLGGPERKAGDSNTNPDGP